ncbi:MAG TPA: hypothetical protein VK539_39375 [Myxococcaceae bacterium]|nr:hypothetical protein [Myxococcaceae bacterium]
MEVEIENFRTLPGGSVSPGGSVTLSYTVRNYTGSFVANYFGNGVTLDGASTQYRNHTVSSSSQVITDTFTVTGSQGDHSISLVPAVDFSGAYEYSVSFYVA